MGFNEMLSILTPTVAQSFEGPSLAIVLTLPFDGVVDALPDALQPTRSSETIAAVKPNSDRETLEFIIRTPFDLPIVHSVLCFLVGAGPAIFSAA
jgi:hypothetical protein